MSRVDWLHAHIDPHAGHSLRADITGALECRTCSKKLATGVEALAAHAEHPLSVVDSPNRGEQPFIDAIWCIRCRVEVVEAADIFYSAMHPEG